MTLLEFFENMIGVEFASLSNEAQLILLGGACLTLTAAVLLFFWVLFLSIKGLTHFND